MPDVDATKFAFAVAGRLEAIGKAEGLERGLSQREAQARFKSLPLGRLTLIAKGTLPSLPVFLMICQELELDPFDYLDAAARTPRTPGEKRVKQPRPSMASISQRLEKHQSKQGVEVPVSRETLSGSRSDLRSSSPLDASRAERLNGSSPYGKPKVEMVK